MLVFMRLSRNSIVTVSFCSDEVSQETILLGELYYFKMPWHLGRNKGVEDVSKFFV